MKNQIHQIRTHSLQQLLKSNFLNITGRIEHYFFPPLCIICDKLTYNNPWFCPDCFQHILNNHNQRSSCPKCSQNLNFRKCACDIIWEYPFDSIYSFLDYDEKVQKIMHHIKYFNKKTLAFYMGALLADYAPENIFNDLQIVTPIPLHWIRKHRRGYNQAEWFARGIVSRQKHLELFTSGLSRKKRTKTQVKLHKEERSQNVKGVFAVSPASSEKLKNRSVLLIDDVITTGATTASCASTLLEAGCKSVRVLSLARD